MPGDSVSTFIDVMQPGPEATASGPEQGQDLDILNRAQVLAKVSDGFTSLDQLVEVTDLPEHVVKTGVDWLSQNGLVDFQSDPSGTGQRLALTVEAKDALHGS